MSSVTKWRGMVIPKKPRVGGMPRTKGAPETELFEVLVLNHGANGQGTHA